MSIGQPSHFKTNQRYCQKPLEQLPTTFHKTWNIPQIMLSAMMLQRLKCRNIRNENDATSAMQFSLLDSKLARKGINRNKHGTYYSLYMQNFLRSVYARVWTVGVHIIAHYLPTLASNYFVNNCIIPTICGMKLLFQAHLTVVLQCFMAAKKNVCTETDEITGSISTLSVGWPAHMRIHRISSIFYIGTLECLDSNLLILRLECL